MTCRDALAALAVVAGALAPLLFGAACAKEEIVLAELPPTAEGGAIVAKRCVDVSDCTEAGFCERHDCADVAGSCQTRPVVCDEEARPVCGCDGITYWNDCERRAAGITAATTGECTTTAHACGHNGPPPGAPPGGPGNPCPPETYCARLLPPPQPGNPPAVACPLDVVGSCWALPAVCPQRAGPDRWNACGPGGPTCVTTCDAIRSGEPHRRANACP